MLTIRQARIGAPDPKILESMEREHTREADSADEFTSHNYMTTTTPRLEWCFVAEPEREEPWPVEGRLASDDGTRRKPLPVKGDDGDSLSKRLVKVNDQLESLGETLILIEEVIGGRLYTGPLFVKYNDTLRGFGAALAGCKGNTYVTTIHVINSVIVKASKLTRVDKVYRGVAGGLLPSTFFEANAQGVRGGVEMAFLSTTFDRSVALEYAQSSGEATAAHVFEMQMGMVDRGAELSWLSQVMSVMSAVSEWLP